jgi:hypothetical protein
MDVRRTGSRGRGERTEVAALNCLAAALIVGAFAEAMCIAWREPARETAPARSPAPPVGAPMDGAVRWGADGFTSAAQPDLESGIGLIRPWAVGDVGRWAPAGH